MEKIKELIMAIQILTGGAAAFRIAFLYYHHKYDEDKKMLHQKVRNVLVAAILIETILIGAGYIKGYYI